MILYQQVSQSTPPLDPEVEPHTDDNLVSLSETPPEIRQAPAVSSTLDSRILGPSSSTDTEGSIKLKTSTLDNWLNVSKSSHQTLSKSPSISLNRTPSSNSSGRSTPNPSAAGISGKRPRGQKSLLECIQRLTDAAAVTKTGTKTGAESSPPSLPVQTADEVARNDAGHVGTEADDDDDDDEAAPVIEDYRAGDDDGGAGVEEGEDRKMADLSPAVTVDDWKQSPKLSPTGEECLLLEEGSDDWKSSCRVKSAGRRGPFRRSLGIVQFPTEV